MDYTGDRHDDLRYYLLCFADEIDSLCEDIELFAYDFQEREKDAIQAQSRFKALRRNIDLFFGDKDATLVEFDYLQDAIGELKHDLSEMLRSLEGCIETMFDSQYEMSDEALFDSYEGVHQNKMGVHSEDAYIVTSNNLEASEPEKYYPLRDDPDRWEIMEEYWREEITGKDAYKNATSCLNSASNKVRNVINDLNELRPADIFQVFVDKVVRIGEDENEPK